MMEPQTQVKIDPRLLANEDNVHQLVEFVLNHTLPIRLRDVYNESDWPISIDKAKSSLHTLSLQWSSDSMPVAACVTDFNEWVAKSLPLDAWRLIKTAYNKNKHKQNAELVPSKIPKDLYERLRALQQALGLSSIWEVIDCYMPDKRDPVWSQTTMQTVVLISCGSQKQSMDAKASELYTGCLFREYLAYANHLCPDDIFILSAKYGLVELDVRIAPYDVRLDKQPKANRKKWAVDVLADLDARYALNRTNFIILAGETYREYLVPEMPFHKVPLEGIFIGAQLKQLAAWMQE